jgi:hypothetical protein
MWVRLERDCSVLSVVLTCFVSTVWVCSCLIWPSSVCFLRAVAIGRGSSACVYTSTICISPHVHDSRLFYIAAMLCLIWGCIVVGGFCFIWVEEAYQFVDDNWVRLQTLVVPFTTRTELKDLLALELQGLGVIALVCAAVCSVALYCMWKLLHDGSSRMRVVQYVNLVVLLLAIALGE